MRIASSRLVDQDLVDRMLLFQDLLIENISLFVRDMHDRPLLLFFVRIMHYMMMTWIVVLLVILPFLTCYNLNPIVLPHHITCH